MDIRCPPHWTPAMRAEFGAWVEAELARDASGTDARQRQDRETGLDPKGDGPTDEVGDAQ